VDAKEATSPLHFCCPVITDDEADAYESDSDDEDNGTLSPNDTLKGKKEEEVNTDNPRPSACEVPQGTRSSPLLWMLKKPLPPFTFVAP
jgi:hypothetical protein